MGGVRDQARIPVDSYSAPPDRFQLNIRKTDLEAWKANWLRPAHHSASDVRGANGMQAEADLSRLSV